MGSVIWDLEREEQMKAIEGRLQLSKGNSGNDESSNSGAGASRVF